MAFKVRIRKNVNVTGVIVRVVATLIALYAGAIMLDVMGSIINGTTSPLYVGLKLIGYTVSSTGAVTATNGTGIMAIIGLAGIASVVMQFVEFKLR